MSQGIFLFKKKINIIPLWKVSTWKLLFFLSLWNVEIRRNFIYFILFFPPIVKSLRNFSESPHNYFVSYCEKSLVTFQKQTMYLFYFCFIFFTENLSRLIPFPEAKHFGGIKIRCISKTTYCRVNEWTFRDENISCISWLLSM
jgi:hypothetical protein